MTYHFCEGQRCGYEQKLDGAELNQEMSNEMCLLHLFFKNIFFSDYRGPQLDKVFPQRPPFHNDRSCAVHIRQVIGPPCHRLYVHCASPTAI